MNEKKANKIIEKAMGEFLVRGNQLDPEKIIALKQILLMSPHNDGFMRISLIGEEKPHLVPFEEIIINGVKGEDIKNYPIEK